MTQRTALAFAAFLTAFILVLAGGAIAYMTQTPSKSTISQSEVVSARPSPTTQDLAAEREAAYREALDKANARLRQANQQLEQAYAQQRAGQSEDKVPPGARRQEPSPAPAASQPQSQPQVSAPTISAERAALLALAVAPGSSLTGMPEQVIYQGMAAYEVLLDTGPVYVDAAGGQVLYNGADGSARFASSRPAVGGDDGEDDEHEEHDDD